MATISMATPATPASMANMSGIGWKRAMCQRLCAACRAPAAGRRPCRTGHTLLEVLAVLSIAALLAAFALPSLQHVLARQQVRAAASDLFSAIELTRAQAMARGQRVLLMPAGPGGMDWRTGWLVFIDSNANLAFDGGDELLFRQGPLAAGITAQFAFSSATAPLYIAYNGAGRSCNATNSLAARWGTLSLALGKQVRHIKINMLGRVRVCDPQRQAANCSGVADSS
ncbi:GspH/FimT family pseudopilin [Janthinobacterium sp. HLX7-2]|uniref:GspH/FimT family pseudopilin n=1 Tax=Janthinobacterium sp. HLX7-2 TaxID=1259331 RepID=UPI003F2251F7